MTTLLKIKDLKKSFIDPQSNHLVPVIDIPHFELNQCEILAIEGKSGCGKTTFLHLIAGLLKPDAGAIYYLEQDVTLLSESKRDLWRARHLGYVFQTFNLLQGYTALENILLGMAFGGKLNHNYAQYLLKRMNVEKCAHLKPRQMSIGQQQRVAVARALANKPQFILADEPTGNLDPYHAEETVRLIVDVCTETGAGLILVSHDTHILSLINKKISLSKINRIQSHADYLFNHNQKS